MSDLNMFNNKVNLTGNVINRDEYGVRSSNIGAHFNTGGVGFTAQTSKNNLSGSLNAGTDGLFGSVGKTLSAEQFSALDGASYLRHAHADEINKTIFGMSREEMAKFGLLNVGDLQYGGAMSLNETNVSSDAGVSKKSIGLGASIERSTGENVGDMFNRFGGSINIGKGASANINGSIGRMNNQNRAQYASLGLGFGVLGFTLNNDLVNIRNGQAYTLPLGSILTSIALPNPMAIWDVGKKLIPQDVDLPRYRALDAHEKLEPKDTPNVQMFKTGEAKFNPEGIQELQRLVSDLKNNPSVKIELDLGSYYERGIMASVAEGFRATFKGKEYNADLSAQRAEAVRDYLIQNGVEASRISMQFSERKATDKTMAVHDYGTNARLIAPEHEKLELQDRMMGRAYTARFHSDFMSPVGLKVVKDLQNDPAFKAFTKDKSDRDIQILTLGAAMHLITTPDVPLTSYLDHVKTQIYDKGLTATMGVATLTDDEIKQNILADKKFQEFAQTLGNDKKEIDAILEVMVDSQREMGNVRQEAIRSTATVDSMIEQYQRAYQSRGFKISEHESTMKAVDDYLASVDQKSKSNPQALTEQEQWVVQRMANATETEKRLFKEAAKALFNNDEIPELKGSRQFDDRYLVGAYKYFYVDNAKMTNLSDLVMRVDPNSYAAKTVHEDFKKTLAQNADYQTLESHWKTLPKERSELERQQVEDLLFSNYINSAAGTKENHASQMLAEIKDGYAKGLTLAQIAGESPASPPPLTAANHNQTPDVSASTLDSQAETVEQKKEIQAEPVKVGINMAALDKVNDAIKTQENVEKPEVQRLSHNSHTF